jgi:DNA-binding transcriptional MerR regulator
MFYSSSQVAARYGITTQSVNRWAREFEEYLSDAAKPGGSKTRQFEKEDMEVFALVSELQKKHLTYDDIHASLKTGARGDAPLVEPDEIQAIVSAGGETRLAIENERLKTMLIDAQDALKKAQADLVRLRETEDEVVRLTERVANKETSETQLRDEIALLQVKVEALAKEAGQQYASGYKAGFTDRNSVNGTDENVQS